VNIGKIVIDTTGVKFKLITKKLELIPVKIMYPIDNIGAQLNPPFLYMPDRRDVRCLLIGALVVLTIIKQFFFFHTFPY
jgi:hypothetical protein